MYPRKNCGVVTDLLADKDLHCALELYRIWRHDAQIQLLSLDPVKAARYAIVEPRPKGQHRQRPDAKAPRSHGGLMSGLVSGI